MTKPRHAWMVRAGNDNELADLVEEKNAVAIGWPEMGDLREWADADAYKGGPDDRLDRSSDSEPGRNYL